MAKLASLAFLLSALIACTTSSDELSTENAYTYYVAPMLCQKQAMCIPTTFAIVFPGGDAECRQKLLDSVSGKKNDLSGCSDAQYKQCRADFLAAMCPADPKAAGIPEKPASCSACAF